MRWRRSAAEKSVKLLLFSIRVAMATTTVATLSTTATTTTPTQTFDEMCNACMASLLMPKSYFHACIANMIPQSPLNACTNMTKVRRIFFIPLLELPFLVSQIAKNRVQMNSIYDLRRKSDFRHLLDLSTQHKILLLRRTQRIARPTDNWEHFFVWAFLLQPFYVQSISSSTFAVHQLKFARHLLILMDGSDRLWCCSILRSMLAVYPTARICRKLGFPLAIRVLNKRNSINMQC